MILLFQMPDDDTFDNRRIPMNTGGVAGNRYGDRGKFDPNRRRQRQHHHSNNHGAAGSGPPRHSKHGDNDMRMSEFPRDRINSRYSADPCKILEDDDGVGEFVVVVAAPE